MEARSSHTDGPTPSCRLSTEFTAWLWGHFEPLLYQQSFLLRTRILRAMIHVNSKITLAGRQKTAHIIVNFVINFEEFVRRFFGNGCLPLCP